MDDLEHFALDRSAAPEHHPIAPDGKVAVVPMQQLGSQIKAQRERRGMTQDEVAETFDWSQSKVARMEAGEVKVSVNDLRGLFRELRIKSTATQNAMLDTARNIKKIKRDTAYDRLIPLVDRQYWQYEAVATRLATYACGYLFPEFLQTEAYAQAVEQTVRTFAPAHCNDEDASLRQRWRQQRAAYFLRPGGPVLDVILDEAVLLRKFYDPAATIIRGLQRLNSAEPGDPFNENVTIRLASFDLSLYGSSAMVCPYTVLSMNDQPVATRYGWTLNESTSTGRSENVGDFQDDFDRLTLRVLSPEDTNDRLEKYISAM